MLEIAILVLSFGGAVIGALWRQRGRDASRVTAACHAAAHMGGLPIALAGLIGHPVKMAKSSVVWSQLSGGATDPAHVLALPVRLAFLGLNLVLVSIGALVIGAIVGGLVNAAIAVARYVRRRRNTFSACAI
jgi:hypothetical protein